MDHVLGQAHEGGIFQASQGLPEGMLNKLVAGVAGKFT